MSVRHNSDPETIWESTWTTLAWEEFGNIGSKGWRSTEAMEVPDGVILMTTVVTVGSAGTSSTAINTMFVPRVKIEGDKFVQRTLTKANKLVPM